MKSRSKGFTLIEMIIAIGVLAILAIGILRLFVLAQVNHKRAIDIDFAVLETNRLIEEFQSLEEMSQKASRFTIYYDENWERSKLKDSMTTYAIYGHLAPLSKDQTGLLHFDLRAVRLLPYPLSSNGEYEIYKIATIIEDKSYWGGNP